MSRDITITRDTRETMTSRETVTSRETMTSHLVGLPNIIQHLHRLLVDGEHEGNVKHYTSQAWHCPLVETETRLLEDGLESGYKIQPSYRAPRGKGFVYSISVSKVNRRGFYQYYTLNMHLGGKSVVAINLSAVNLLLTV